MNASTSEFRAGVRLLALVALLAATAAQGCGDDAADADMERTDGGDSDGGSLAPDAGGDAGGGERDAAQDAGGGEQDAAQDASGGEQDAGQDGGDDNDSDAGADSGPDEPENRAPSADDGSAATAEDTTVAGTVSGSDPDGDELTFALDAAPSHGTVDLDADGSFSYAPAQDYAGTDSFTFVASDGDLTSSPATVTITISAVNDAPVASDDMLTLAEGDTATMLAGGASSLLANDADPDGDTLTVNVVPITNPSHGILTLNGDGTFSYAHDGGESTSDGFVYEVCDDAATPECDTAAATIEIMPVNDAPVASGGPFMLAPPVTDGTTVGTISVDDPDAGQTHTFGISAGNDEGIYTIDADGVIRVADASAVSGARTDMLTIDVQDSGSPQLSDSLVVTITILEPPTAVADGPLQVVSGVAAGPFDLLGNDSLGAPAAGVVSFGGGSLGGEATDHAADGTAIALAGGTVSLGADGALNVQLVTPGTYTFTYRLDNGVVSSAEVTLVVCDALAVGDAITARPDQLESFCFASSDSGASEYLLIPMNLTQGSSYPLSVVGTGLATAGGGAPSLGSALGSDSHSATRAAHQAEVDARRTVPGDGTPVTPASTIPSGVPSENDAWSLNVDVSTACTSGTAQAATVRAVGTHAIVVTDDSNPPGGFDDEQLDAIAYNFDEVIYPAVTSVLGEPGDHDGNDRVVLFVTAALNRLSPPASSAVTYARELARDLLPQTHCPTSNQGEIIYLLTPDPTGAINSNVRTVSSTFPYGHLAHQLAHLIVDSRRLQAAAPFEEGWLDEGLAHIAMERCTLRGPRGLATVGTSGATIPTVEELAQLSTGQNIALATLTTGPYASRRVLAFNSFVNLSYGELRNFLQRPGRHGFTDSSADNTSMRGGAYQFLRYAADRYAAETAQSEALFFQDLVESTTSGVDNLEDVIGSDPTLWMRDYLTAVYVDDSGVPDLDEPTEPYGISTWSYRSVYGALGGFPLLVSGLTSDTPVDLQMGPGGTALYIRVALAAGGVGRLTFTPPDSGGYDVWYRLARID